MPDEDIHCRALKAVLFRRTYSGSTGDEIMFRIIRSLLVDAISLSLSINKRRTISCMIPPVGNAWRTFCLFLVISNSWAYRPSQERKRRLSVTRHYVFS